MTEDALRQAFIAALPERMVGLEMAYESWRLAQHDAAQALEEFYRLSHNLAGAAALYGFEEVSAPSRVLECHLRAVMRDADNGIVSKDDGVSPLLAAVRSGVRAVLREAESQVS